MTTELEQLFPDTTYVLGMQVGLLKFKDFKKVFQFIKKYSHIFSEEEDVVSALLEIGDEAIEELVEIACCCCSLAGSLLTKEYIEGLYWNEVVDLFLAIFEVNSAFFLQVINEGSERISRTLGGQQFKGSLNTGIDGETSKNIPTPN